MLTLVIFALCTLASVALTLRAATLTPAWPGRGAFTVAMAVTTVWAGVSVMAGPASPGGWSLTLDLSLFLQSFGWLALLLRVRTSLDPSGLARTRRFLTPHALIPVALGGMVLLLIPRLPGGEALTEPLRSLSWITNIIVAVAGLVLVESVYGNSGPAGRWGLKHLLLALATLFAFDLFFYSNALLMRKPSADLIGTRALLTLLVVPLLAVSLSRTSSWTRPDDLLLTRSPATTVQNLALLGSGISLLLMGGAGFLVQRIGGQWGAALQATILIGGFLLMMAVLGSGRFRAQMKVLIHKTFFTYAYDYREEWRRFIGRISTHQPRPLGDRILHAIADMMDSPAGALWVRQRQNNSFVPESAWNYRGKRLSEPASSPLVSFLGRSGWIIELEAAARSPASYPGLAVPDWITAHRQAWLLIPLLHRGEILALLVLDRARAPRRLDWEDRDLLKLAATQAASYLAEEMTAAALSDARQLEDFNHRVSFIAHDLKTIVGQMSLMIENARRFGDNPAFQRDMIGTVAHSVERMRALLDQLSTQQPLAEPLVGVVDVIKVADAVVERWSQAGPNVELIRPDHPLAALAIETTLFRVLDLLIDNAVEAIGPAGTVSVRIRAEKDRAIVEIRDDGPGMNPDFVRDELFRPRHTTKSHGHGLGAYQTRHLTQAMGGALEVESAPDRGTTMRIILPMAASVPG